MGTVCPQCGSAAGVHSIEELAAMARARLGQAPGAGPAPQPGPAADPQPGWAAEPQAGWAAEPQAGALPGRGGWRGGSSFPSDPGGDSFSRSGDIASALGDDIAGAALGAASRFIGRAISRRVQEKLSQQVLPAMAAKQDAMLREQIAIAERHPDLRACLTDHVIFLAGGSRVLPMPNLAGVTVEQSDALVASLRDG
jgi:hypothetical protein